MAELKNGFLTAGRGNGYFADQAVKGIPDYPPAE